MSNPIPSPSSQHLPMHPLNRARTTMKSDPDTDMPDVRVKTETSDETAKAETGTAVKTEPGPAADDGLYEDDAGGDLEFYDKEIHNKAYGSVYLARVPKYLWETWDGIDDDEEIQIGTMRCWTEKGTGQPRMQLLLSSDRQEHQSLPREYSIEMAAMDVENTFVFTEEELPRYKAVTRARQEATAAGIPAYLLRAKTEDDKVQKRKFTHRKGGRYQPQYPRAVPKKTKLFGKVKYEVTCQPLQNEETEQLLLERNERLYKPKAEVQTLGRPQFGTRPAARSSSAAAVSNFTQTNVPKDKKARKQESLKAARIPRDQLLDLIFQCFRQFQYWPLRTMRQRLQQPELYLRQTLDEIAFLNKSGPFANLWSLKPEFRLQDAAAAAAAEAAAPDAEGDGDDDNDADADDDDDDAEEMEDVAV